MLTDSFVEHVIGKGRFVDDLVLPGMLHLHVVRSRYARARITNVSGGITNAELPATVTAVGEGAAGRPESIAYPVLAKDYVNYEGQPVAAVLGRDRYEAEDIADSVQVEYEPLAPVMDPLKAMNSPPIHPGTTSNIGVDVQVGQDFELQDAPVVITRKIDIARVSPNPMEPRSILVDFDGHRLTVYASTQSIHSWRRGLASSLHLDPNMIRVVQMDTGGAFGSKSAVYPEYIIAAYAAMKYRKPVKWVESRSEHLRATNQGRGVRAEMTIYADRSATILGIKGSLVVDTGAYMAGQGTFAPRWIAMQICGPYAIKNASVRARAVLTNKVPLGPYRGAGRPEAGFIMERMIDSLADELKMDPLEVRLRNATTQNFTSPLGLTIGPMKQFLESASKELDYSSKSRLAPTGISFFILWSAVQPGESAMLKVKGGRVKVMLGGSSTGQGHEIMARKVLNQELGIPESVVDFEQGDTEQLDEGVGSWGSRTAIVAGGALVMAANKLKEEVAKKGWRYSPEELLKGEYEVKVNFNAEVPVYSPGFNLVSVMPDPHHGVSITECSAYYDVGRVLNPDMVYSQVAGGSTQAIGEVLYEEARYSEDGALLVGTLVDAGLLYASEVPNFITKLGGAPSPLPPGAKGVGESPTIGVPPAFVKALEAASGSRIDKLPVPQDIMSRLIEKANHK
ncbi:MAG: xanthine dehydrogenase family protein molybdopterin-binding subunit [Nitrososphaerota archaeon]|jgi:carbon-monoxide dehydrogenase large subunit|nr:xanthine dehydrogenase family protein molybdopterin-binding subunit [Nitrososphaerota archaeon]